MVEPEAFMGGLLTVAGASGLVYALLFVWLPARRTHDWPRVTGVVTRSAVARQSTSTGYGNPNTFHKAALRYRYTVKGRKYEGRAHRFGGSLALSLPGRAEAIAARYRTGDEVDVYYDPRRPARACLEPGEETSLFMAGVSAVFLLVGWMF